MTTHTPLVVLDPGHGGRTKVGGSSPNSTSGGGLLEKDVNLDVARRVKELLGAGSRVMMTRESDTNLSLSDRAGFARALGADVFLSIHCNGHLDLQHDSTEVYITRDAPPATDEFAQELQRSVSGAIGTRTGGVVRADLGVLLPSRHASETVVALVELFDLTNPERAGQATDVAFLDRVAAAVAEVIDGRLPTVQVGPAAAGLTAAPRGSVRTPGVLRVAERLREEGVSADDIEGFLAALEGGPAPLSLPQARIASNGQTVVELPPAHLFEGWKADLVLAALGGTPISGLIHPLQALATAHDVTIGIGPSGSGGMVTGAGLSVGLVIGPGGRIGFYGTVSGLLGAVFSISATMTVTVIYGGPSMFSGSAIAAGVTVDAGAGPTVGAHVLLPTGGGDPIGITGEIGVSVGLSPVEAFIQYQRTGTTLSVPRGASLAGNGARAWETVSLDERRVYVMERLVAAGYPENGAAGIVGNLEAESGIIPARIEGSRSATPMRATDLHGQVTDFTAQQVMDRDRAARLGPRLPGVGLAQWTSSRRREGLFTHSYNGTMLGSQILYDMDAQIDYLVRELRHSYRRVDAVLRDPSVTVDDAADEVVYNYEVPGSVLSDGSKRPRSDARVQEIFRERRSKAHAALTVYRRTLSDGQGLSTSYRPRARATARIRADLRGVSDIGELARRLLAALRANAGFVAGVEDPTFFPHSAICQLRTHRAVGPGGIGTGFYIAPDRILTCGHNILLGPKVTTAIEVHPGRHHNMSTYPSFTVSGSSNWATHPRHNHSSTWSVATDGRVLTTPTFSDFDLAIIKVSTPPPHGEYFEIEEQRMSPASGIAVCGYAATDDVEVNQQNLDVNHVQEVLPERFTYPIQTRAGNSGSPVFYIDGGAAVATGVHSRAGGDYVNIGCRLTDAKVGWIRSV